MTAVGEDDEVAVQPFEVGAVPSAKSIRRFTSQAANSRGGASIGSLLGGVYYAVISIAISIGIALGFAQAMRASLPSAPEVEAPLTLSLATLVVVIIVALAGALLSLAGRLGPVGAGGAEAAWWLGLPVDRRGLLRPAARRLPLLAGFVGAVLVALLDAGLLADPGLRVVRVATTAALVAGGIVLLAAVGQSAGVSRRSLALAGDVLLFLAPVTAVVLARVGWSVRRCRPRRGGPWSPWCP